MFRFRVKDERNFNGQIRIEDLAGSKDHMFVDINLFVALIGERPWLSNSPVVFDGLIINSANQLTFENLTDAHEFINTFLEKYRI